ncbi:MAG: four helix bundle protein [Burkholderiales bacterium]|jgi:four helix bundle protein|nr:four helix bundle protein [Burkholderiales bacterium]
MSDERNPSIEVRTTRFALEIIKLCGELPRSMPGEVLGRQILRSGTSVGAQYREAKRAKSVADFVSKIEGALQEIEETSYWLELISSSSMLAKKRTAPLASEAEELTAMLAASAITAKRRRQ